MSITIVTIGSQGDLVPHLALSRPAFGSCLPSLPGRLWRAFEELAHDPLLNVNAQATGNAIQQNDGVRKAWALSSKSLVDD